MDNHQLRALVLKELPSRYDRRTVRLRGKGITAELKTSAKGGVQGKRYIIGHYSSAGDVFWLD